MKHLLRSALMLAMASGVLATSSGAQGSSQVTLILKDNFGKTPINAIVRVDPNKFPRPIIAVRRSALSPALLMAAVNKLAAVRQRFGDSTSRQINVEITDIPARPIKDTDRVWANGVIGSLKARPESNLAVIGRARELVISLP